VLLNKHQQRTEHTKAKLFGAAQRVFAKRGFEAATIDQIARSAGFSRGAFYAHFKTKEDLFLAMLEDKIATELQKLSAHLKSVPKQEHIGLLRQYCLERFHDLQWALLLLEFKLYLARRGAKAVKLAERYQALRENIKRQYLPEVLPLDPPKLALFEAFMDGLSLQRAYKGALFTAEQAEEALLWAFDHVLDR
jgi:AcrR family transcriptional regulator